MAQQANLIIEQSKQVAFQGVIAKLVLLSKADQAALLPLLKSLTLGMTPEQRTEAAGNLPDSDQALFARASGVYQALDACKAAGMAGNELLARLRKQVQDPAFRPF